MKIKYINNEIGYFSNYREPTIELNKHLKKLQIIIDLG